ncbi:CW-type Zinc Finger protein [Cardiosporidium cionae]|uniref:CW-type Zinc Finger protein n=1 Tax=Cardiosporidium cionae TaxID=476202 RepID=A0ABQ7JFT6_9APIC|nr:CW-type Zinc Finger protein [Cardiosporidium cionae]|eukprot:KAF8822836.1 CW-type Zinc Finger protein [Cardiosporidium cionae]
METIQSLSGENSLNESLSTHIGPNNRWVQCDKCDKWRRLPGCTDEEYEAIEADDRWECSMNKWDLVRASCSSPEEDEIDPRVEPQSTEKLSSPAQEILIYPAAPSTRYASPPYRKSNPPKLQRQTVESDTTESSYGIAKDTVDRITPDGISTSSLQAYVSNISVRKVSGSTYVDKKLSSFRTHRVGGLSSRSKSSKKKAEGSTVSKISPSAADTLSVSSTPSISDGGDLSSNIPEAIDWVQCENCLKWRKLLPGVNLSILPSRWTCDLNINPLFRRCSDPQEVYTPEIEEESFNAHRSNYSRTTPAKRMKLESNGGDVSSFNKVGLSNFDEKSLIAQQAFQGSTAPLSLFKSSPSNKNESRYFSLTKEMPTASTTEALPFSEMPPSQFIAYTNGLTDSIDRSACSISEEDRIYQDTKQTALAHNGSGRPSSSHSPSVASVDSPSENIKSSSPFPEGALSSHFVILQHKTQTFAVPASSALKNANTLPIELSHPLQCDASATTSLSTLSQPVPVSLPVCQDALPREEGRVVHSIFSTTTVDEPTRKQSCEKLEKPVDNPFLSQPGLSKGGKSELSLNLDSEDPLAVLNWVQCEMCKKWRRLPPQILPESLADHQWFCHMNTWDRRNSCDIPEEDTVTVNASQEQRKILLQSSSATPQNNRHSTAAPSNTPSRNAMAFTKNSSITHLEKLSAGFGKAKDKKNNAGPAASFSFSEAKNLMPDIGMKNKTSQGATVGEDGGKNLLGDSADKEQTECRNFLLESNSIELSGQAGMLSGLNSTEKNASANHGNSSAKCQPTTQDILEQNIESVKISILRATHEEFDSHSLGSRLLIYATGDATSNAFEAVEFPDGNLMMKMVETPKTESKSASALSGIFSDLPSPVNASHASSGPNESSEATVVSAEDRNKAKESIPTILKVSSSSNCTAPIAFDFVGRIPWCEDEHMSSSDDETYPPLRNSEASALLHQMMEFCPTLKNQISTNISSIQEERTPLHSCQPWTAALKISTAKKPFHIVGLNDLIETIYAPETCLLGTREDVNPSSRNNSSVVKRQSIVIKDLPQSVCSTRREASDSQCRLSGPNHISSTVKPFSQGASKEATKILNDQAAAGSAAQNTQPHDHIIPQQRFAFMEGTSFQRSHKERHFDRIPYRRETKVTRDMHDVATMSNCLLGSFLDAVCRTLPDSHITSCEHPSNEMLPEEVGAMRTTLNYGERRRSDATVIGHDRQQLLQTRSIPAIISKNVTKTISTPDRLALPPPVSTANAHNSKHLSTFNTQ